MIKPFFEVEDYRPVSGQLYQYTLKDTVTGESIAPLTAKQGGNMKELLQLWYINQQSESIPISKLQELIRELNPTGKATPAIRVCIYRIKKLIDENSNG